MSDPAVRRVRGTYRNGRIELEEPLPELEGMSLAFDVSFPEGEGGSPSIRAAVHYPGPILELGEELSALAYGESPPLPRLIGEYRHRLSKKSGFDLPLVRILASSSVLPQAYAIYLNGARIGRGTVRPDKHLAVASTEAEEETLEGFSGEAVRDPIFNLPAKWMIARRDDAVLEAGLTLATPAGVIAGHLEELISQLLPLALSREAVHKRLQSLRKSSPNLVEDALARLGGESEFHILLRELLSRKLSIRDLPSIMEDVLAYDRDDPEGRVNHVARKRVPFDDI